MNNSSNTALLQVSGFSSELRRRLKLGIEHRLEPDGHIVGGGFLRRRRAHSIIGLPGAGKSMVLSHLALCLRTGEKFFGRPVAKATVLFFAAEASDSTLDRLVVAARRAGLEWPVEGLWVVPGGLDLKDEEQVAAVIALARQTNADIVIIDTANASGSGDEGPGDMGAYAAALNRIVQETGVALLVSHHTPATGGERERGHSSLRGLLDMSSVVKKVGADRHLSIGKARDGEEELFGAFHIEGEALGTTNLGETWAVPYLIETVAKPTQATDSKPEAAVKQKKKDERLVEAIVRELCQQPSCVPEWPSCQRAAVHQEFLARTAKGGLERSERSKTSIVNQCLRSLADRGVILPRGAVPVNVPIPADAMNKMIYLERPE